MKARIASTVAATAVAALVLSGCGSDDGGSKSDDKLKGADTANEPKDKPSGSPDAPEFDLPDDVQVEISDDETGEKAKDEILREHGYALMAQQEAYAVTEPTANFKRYWDDVAAGKLEASFEAYRKDGQTITGLDRFYFREVTWIRGDQAMVAFCEDQSEAYDKDVETDKVIKDERSIDDYIDVRTTLEKTGTGWKVVDLTGQRGSQECRDKA